MTQEDKQLLLKDICARLPYNCRVFYEYVDDLDGKTYGYSLTLNTAKIKTELLIIIREEIYDNGSLHKR